MQKTPYFDEANVSLESWELLGKTLPEYAQRHQRSARHEFNLMEAMDPDDRVDLLCVSMKFICNISKSKMFYLALKLNWLKTFKSENV